MKNDVATVREADEEHPGHRTQPNEESGSIVLHVEQGLGERPPSRMKRPAVKSRWGPGSIPNNWADVCGFLKLPWLSAFLESEQTWRLFHSSTSSRFSRQ